MLRLAVTLCGLLAARAPGAGLLALTMPGAGYAPRAHAPRAPTPRTPFRMPRLDAEPSGDAAAKPRSSRSAPKNVEMGPPQGSPAEIAAADAAASAQG